MARRVAEAVACRGSVGRDGGGDEIAQIGKGDRVEAYLREKVLSRPGVFCVESVKKKMHAALLFKKNVFFLEFRRANV